MRHILALLLISACTGPPEVPLDPCVERATAICERLFGCGLLSTPDICIDAQNQFCTTVSFADGPACTAAMEAWSCDTLYVYGTIPQECAL